MPAQAQAEITRNRQSIAGLLSKYNPDININLSTANPVSYTHLDVYKRQWWNLFY